MTSHRKSLRRASLALHRLASDLRARRGHVPADEPAGYVDALAAAVRSRALTLERTCATSTCREAKDAALAAPNPHPPGTVAHLAHGRSAQATLTLVNAEATKDGVDPYERDGSTKTRG